MLTSLSGDWLAKPDPDEIGASREWFSPEYRRNSWEKFDVPSCWNSKPQYDHYEGAFWYAHEFDLDHVSPEAEREYFLRFLGVNYFCRVWINGHELGKHEGGYLPFEFRVDQPMLKMGGNLLVVMVENKRAANRIPGELCDWFNYGGIIRDVSLEDRSVNRFDSVKIFACPENNASGAVTVKCRQTAPYSFDWKILFKDSAVAQGSVEPAESEFDFSTVIDDAQLWSPDTPNLYRIEIEPHEKDCDGFSSAFGIREFCIDGNRVLLNGKQIKMKGVSLHEEQVPAGRCLSKEQRYKDVRDIKRLGFNALRTAHYTHDEMLTQAADEIGLLILEEIPVYWDLDYADPHLFDLAASMVRDMINRDFNHPSVIQWSVGNEVPVERPDCDKFIRGLMSIAREMDPTRLVSYVSCRFLIDETRVDSDTCCINCYLGWYYGMERDLENLLMMVKTTAPNQPWIMTEFGAGAKIGFRSPLRIKFSEEKQDRMLKHYIRTLNSMDWVAGWFIWIYRDFRSPIRMNRHQQGFNRKGIVSEKNESKLVCHSFPLLADEKYEVKQKTPPEWKMFVFKRLEDVMYKVFQPQLASSQRKQYNDFYNNKVGSEYD